ncbi:MAG: LysR substrate-binding domain-containing protein [Rhizobiaceae bacterium]
MHKKNQHVKITKRVSTRLKFKQLRLLVAIDEHRSILHAANALNMSQPAATKLLKDLEADFSVKLFDRTNRGVIPTEFGDALVRHGKVILTQISHAAQELDDINDGLGGRVVIGTLLTASAKLLPNTIKKVHEARPNVSIVVKDGTNDVLMPLLHTGDLDLVLGRLAEYRHREGLIQETLFKEQLVVACRKDHPLSTKKAVSTEQLAECNWILPPVETTLRRQIEKEFFDRGHAPPKIGVECVSFLTIRALLAKTDMLCMLPLNVVENELAQGALATIHCKLHISSGLVGVSYRSLDALSPAAHEFLKELRVQAQCIADPESQST